MPKKSALAWPVFREYDQDHLARIALPLGGIGTGTVSLGGRGDLRDWEIMNRPAKGFRPHFGRGVAPFFALYAKPENGEALTRALEGPLESYEYEGDTGSHAPNHGLPRFRNCRFEAAYPLAQVHLSDPEVPLKVRLEAFNPLVPGDADISGMPVAVLRFVLENPTRQKITASVCGTMPNFIGIDGLDKEPICGNHDKAMGASRNRNRFRKGRKVQGVFMYTRGVKDTSPAWGNMALTTTARAGVTSRTAWLKEVRWGEALLDFWDDFSANGKLTARKQVEQDMPAASLAVRMDLAPRTTRSVTFFITWHFPNRYTWSPKHPGKCCSQADLIGNYYTEQYRDAWQVAEKTAEGLPQLEKNTVQFVNAFCQSNLPRSVKEAALFNLSTLRSQTCFRTPDGRFYGYEGCCDNVGCCHGSCTHVWNYEQATAFLFGDLAMTMREVEFDHATDQNGLMSFRVNLPIQRAKSHGKAAADGQMGCLMKLYRDWQLSGDDAWLKKLWPKAKKAVQFCWIKNGWDADQDGVMEGCQHNTMDVEYFGPNPQMQIWYLGALRAAQEMAAYIGDQAFADTCGALYQKGRIWTDNHLFNGEYYEHKIQPPKRSQDVPACLYLGMGGDNLTKPDYQLGSGCLVDQLVGQFMAHVCGLGYLVKPTHVRKTLRNIFQYNRRQGFHSHFNNMRSYVLGDETALLMASYPRDRPRNPFPYFTEVVTGFEHTAAIGMLYEGQTRNGLQVIQDVRDRYDGKKRNPFDEAECGHHYARAMASWAAILALTGFQYSAVTKTLTFAAQPGTFFWSNGYAWGTCTMKQNARQVSLQLEVLHGSLAVQTLCITGYGKVQLPRAVTLKSGTAKHWKVTKT